MRHIHISYRVYQMNGTKNWCKLFKGLCLLKKEEERRRQEQTSCLSQKNDPPMVTQKGCQATPQRLRLRCYREASLHPSWAKRLTPSGDHGGRMITRWKPLRGFPGGSQLLGRCLKMIVFWGLLYNGSTAWAL